MRAPRTLAALVALLAATLASGCGASPEAVREAQVASATRGLRRVRADLLGLLARARQAIVVLPDLAALAPAARFDALERVRVACGVDGLAWEDPGGESAWAGRVAELRPSGPLPWAGSFRAGDVSVHLGPGLRALVVGPVAAANGHLRVTQVLEQATAPALEAPFAQRWSGPLGLAEVALLPLGARVDEDRWPFPQGRGEVAEPGRPAPALRVVVRPAGPEATRDRLVARHERRAGTWLLAGLALLIAAGTLALRRWLPRGGARAAGYAGLVVLARAGLTAIDLPRRFPAMAEGFAASDFGVVDPLGWLASPADLAATALAFLLLAGLAARRPWPTPVTPRARVMATALGSTLAAGMATLWLAMTALAVAQGRTPFFQSSSFLPPWPVALMLTALVAFTAACALLAAHGLSLAASALPTLPRALSRALVAALAAALALALGSGGPPTFAVLLLPAVAALPLSLSDGREAAVSPSRVLLLGLLATALLFPLLWTRVAERRRDQLRSLLQRMLDHEDTAVSDVRLDLAALAEDASLREALTSARAGPRPEGLALALWARTLLVRPHTAGVLSVLDAQGRLLDEFSLDATPRKRLPAPVPPVGADDLQLLTARGDGATLRAVVGRLRVRGPPPAPSTPGEVLGHVVLTMPDPAALLLAGAPTGEDAAAREDALLADRRPVEVALLRQGRVVASSAPQVSREPGGFGPLELGGLGASRPEWTWSDERGEGAAAFSAARSGVLAVRRRAADLGDLVLALSRLVVIGVGTAALAALAIFVAGLHRFRARLHHRILASYFVVSIIPLVLLGWASASEARTRHDERFSERLETDVARARVELEAQGPQLFDLNTDEALRRAAWERRHDVILYRAGRVSASSRAGLVEAEVQPARLPADAYRATTLERRAAVRREVGADGRAVWTGYAPVLGADGHALATVAVPLLYDKDRIDEELTVTGSVVLAGYLLTLVLVLAIGIYSARRLARPIDLLAQGTERVAGGDLSVELPGAGPDELGQVVAAFNAMTQALRVATEKAARAEREAAWRGMARQVAHEIKNPLSPMKLMVQQMQADLARDPAGGADSVRRTAAVLLRQIDALARIAGTFGELARLPRRTLAPVDVGALLAHVVDLHAGARVHGIEVVGRAPADLPRVLADEEELRRVLVNLVGNAVEAVGRDGRVELEAHAQAGPGGAAGVAVSVRDSGVGIAPEHRARLFEPTFSTKTSGTGLGLAIVKRILDDMGATIEVASEPGRGSTFRMWWPARPAGVVPGA